MRTAIFLFFLLWSSFLQAQHRIDFKSASLDTLENLIRVRYDLKGKNKRAYNINLYYSDNQGNTFRGPLRSVYGDVGEGFAPGPDKQITWEFKKDNPYFRGKKQVTFRIEAIELPKIGKGGPQHAVKSLLVPGWGDLYVRDGYNYWWITALAYGGVAGGITTHFIAKNAYNKHQNRVADNAPDHRSYLTRAELYNNWSVALLSVGITTWATDVLGVYIKGKKNRKLYPDAENRPETEAKPTAKLEPLVVPSFGYQPNQYGFLLKF